jgi:hypothetical protein
MLDWEGTTEITYFNSLHSQMWKQLHKRNPCYIMAMYGENRMQADPFCIMWLVSVICPLICCLATPYREGNASFTRLGLLVTLKFVNMCPSFTYELCFSSLLEICAINEHVTTRNATNSPLHRLDTPLVCIEFN